MLLEFQTRSTPMRWISGLLDRLSCHVTAKENHVAWVQIKMVFIAIR